jgi:hypothetical protein
MILIALLAVPLALTSVEFCSAAPQPPATEPPEWHWRMVDGKKCYFRADKLLPREDLVWSYDAKKLDLDEGTTVRGQFLEIAPERFTGAPSMQFASRGSERVSA